MKKPAMSFGSIIVLAVIAFLAVTVVIPYLKKQPAKQTFQPINSGGYREYDNSKNNSSGTMAQRCASIKSVKQGIRTYETCYDKNGKVLYTQKIID